MTEYKEVMSKLLTIVQELRLIEDNLAQAAAAHDTARLDAVVRSAQPTLLSFRGLDQRRSRLEKSLGISGMHFDILLESLPSEEAAEVAPLLQDLTEALRSFEESKDTADRMMQVRLSDVNAVLQDAQILPKPAFKDTLA